MACYPHGDLQPPGHRSETGPIILIISVRFQLADSCHIHYFVSSRRQVQTRIYIPSSRGWTSGKGGTARTVLAVTKLRTGRTADWRLGCRRKMDRDYMPWQPESVRGKRGLHDAVSVMVWGRGTLAIFAGILIKRWDWFIHLTLRVSHSPPPTFWWGDESKKSTPLYLLLGSNRKGQIWARMNSLLQRLQNNLVCMLMEEVEIG